MKLEILIDDDETRALWETAKKAKAEVESWPAWKHNELPRAPPDASASGEVARSAEDRRSPRRSGYCSTERVCAVIGSQRPA
jgi:hypothetical protein